MTYRIFFDLETGGLEPTHPVIQLAAVVIDEHWTEVAAFEKKIAFDEAKADPQALAVNHYTAEAWIPAVSPLAAAAKMSAFARPYLSKEMLSKRTGAPYFVGVLAGYNALTFDLPRFKALYGDAFFPFSYQVRDYLQRAFFWFDEVGLMPPENFKLATVCAYFGITADGVQHDALTDARLTVALAKRLSEPRGL